MPKENVYLAYIDGGISKHNIVVPNPVRVAASKFIEEYDLHNGDIFIIEDEEGVKFKFIASLRPISKGIVLLSHKEE